jgi:hypothetical protein
MSYGFVGEDEDGKEQNRWHIRLYVEVMRRRQPKPQPEDMRQINLKML